MVTSTLAAHRPLTCTVCGGLVHVLDIPEGHIDPRRYVCGDCLEERAAVRAERAEQRPAVAYNEFPAGY